MRAILTLLLTVLLASTSFADLDAAERRWVRACVEGLASKNERLRKAAEDGLVGIGADAVPAILGALDPLKTDEAWAALGQALTRMGEPAAAALDKARTSWPKAHASRLETSVEAIRKAAAAAKAQVSAPAEVRRLLETFRGAMSYRGNGPEVRRIVAMGRAAVPTLFEVVEESQGHDTTVSAAIDALDSLTVEADLPRIRGILLGGTTQIAKALRFRSKEVADLLVEAVEQDLVDFDICGALESYRKDERVVPALLAWLARRSMADEFRLSAAAQFLGGSRDAAAVEPLLRARPRATDMQTVLRLGEALADLGAKEGIEMLVTALERPPDVTPSGISLQAFAGMKLNEIAGRRIFTGSNRVRPNEEEENAAAAKAAAPEFRKWWDEVEDRIRFDRAARAWVVP